MTLFAPLIEDGRVYTVVFINADGNGMRSATGTAVVKRDFADGVMKSQLSVPAPDLGPGPTEVFVLAATS